METVSKNFRFNDTIYNSDKEGTIRSVIGNDVKIIEYHESDIIIDNIINVNVKYEMLNFNAFKLYKVEKTKLLKLLSDRYIIDEIIDTLTNERIKIKIIVDFNITDSPKFIYIKYFSSPYPDITLYGKEITINDVFHSWCSIYDAQYLSYHKTKIDHILKDDQQFKTLLKDNVKIDIEKELKAYEELTAFKNNNYNNTCYDITYLKGETEIIDVSNQTPNDLRKLINETGILILSEFRFHPYALIKIKNTEVIITPQTIENLIIVLEYDGYNYNMLKN